MDHVVVRLDFPKLQKRLTLERGRDMDAAEVNEWLGQMGFVRRTDWQCARESLRRLQPGELIEMRGLFTEDGVTFVELAASTHHQRQFA